MQHMLPHFPYLVTLGLSSGLAIPVDNAPGLRLPEVPCLCSVGASPISGFYLKQRMLLVIGAQLSCKMESHLQD